MSNIYFHVGYPKSASTTLQKQLFNKHSQIINLGLYPTKNIGIDTEIDDKNSIYLNDPIVKKFYDNLLKKDNINYDENENKILLEKMLKKYNEKDKIFVFSEERATSVFFTHSDIGLKADRIKRLIPDAKIIIVVRNQIDALSSMYADFPFDPRSFAIGKPIDIDNWINIILEEEFIYYKEMLNYFNVIEYYTKLFGEDNMCILNFDDIVKEKEKFAINIANFMRINKDEVFSLISLKHENKRVSHRYNIARTIKRKYFSNISIKSIIGESYSQKILNYLKKGNSKKYRISDENLNRVYKYYIDNNLLLEKQYGIKIKNRMK